MGLSLSWFAVRGKSPETVQKELGFRPTGAKGSFPENRISGASLADDWYVVCHWRHEFKDTKMERLSQSAEVVACFVEEHVMFSKSAAWRDGRRVWSITHNSEKGLRHLATEGELPECFAAIRDRLTAQQAEDTCDFIFDIPVEVATRLTGFCHNETRDEVQFEVLDGGSFLKKLFGR